MKNKILYLILLLTMLGVWGSCDYLHTIRYDITEKDSPYDTTIVVENMEQYRSIYVQTYWEWDDTVILSGIKKPAQSFILNKRIANHDDKDTIHITFDKYKAKKVRIHSEMTFMQEDCID